MPTSYRCLLALGLSCLFLACSPPPRSWFCARNGWGGLTSALKKCKAENGRYPRRLEDLVPRYLASLSPCRWTESLPEYTVSSDGLWYGLVCRGEHREWPKERAELIALSSQSEYPEFSGYVTVEECSKNLEKVAHSVKVYRLEKGALPPSLEAVGIKPDDVGRVSYALTLIGGGHYQIVCVRPDHVSLGCAPLSHRYDSRLGRVVALHAGHAQPYHWHLELVPFLVVMIGLLLGPKWGRKRLRPRSLQVVWQVGWSEGASAVTPPGYLATTPRTSESWDSFS